jgi:hypothetical protein
MPAIGEIIQYTFIMEDTGQTIENVVHFRELIPGKTDAQLKSESQLWWGLMSPLCTNSTHFVETRIKRMTPTAFDFIIEPAGAVNQGTHGGNSMNLTLTVVATLRTGVAGKTHRGRIYLPPLWSGNVGAGENSLSSSGVINYITWRDAVMATWGPTGTSTVLQLGIYSRVLGGTKPFTVAGWQPVTAIEPKAVLGNQRRRRQFIGI